MVVRWQNTLKDPNQISSSAQNRGSMVVNGVGAVCTAIALIVVLATKFVDGAWITLLLITAMVIMFERVKRHYERVSDHIFHHRPLDVAKIQPPVVVLPLRQWSVISEKALRFGMQLSPTVIAVHLATNEDEADRLKKRWNECVECPIVDSGIAPPVLMIVDLPFRQVFSPLFDIIKNVEGAFPGRTIAVVIPELVGSHWYHFIMHNQQSTALKASLLLRGDQRIIMVNVPWYLDELRDAD